MKKKQEASAPVNTDVLEMVNSPGWQDYIREVRKAIPPLRKALLGNAGDNREYLRGRFVAIQETLELAYKIVGEDLPDSVRDMFH